MALTATIYNLDTELADVDRGVYETLAVRLARQPSETLEYMLTRFLAYCLEYTEGIELTEGVAAGDDPAVLVRDLTGRVTAWIEVGLPDAQRLHRGSKLAGRAAVYTHRNVTQVLAELNGRKIHRAAEIPVYEFGRGFVEAVAAVVPRRAAVAVSITERQLYLGVDGKSFSTTVVEHRIS
ncbi:MAG TPA: YaeQ family protein [Candidatus Polarisedimenticolia bacterium]|nr:YaeQ family protein [Candidatus Polarisedimenticolia bacterium]